MSLSFIQGFTEHYSSGDNHSAVKKLSQRGRGETSLCGFFFFFFLARKFTQSSIHLGKRWLLITKNRYLKIVILVLFHFFSSCLQRGKNRVVEIPPEIPIWLSKGLFTQSTECLILPFILDASRGARSVGSCSGLPLNPCRTGWWAVLFALYLHSFRHSNTL